MNVSAYIARRYLFSRKSMGAINIISAISVCGVTLATMAMVCTLSVFNGFHDLVEGMFTHFDPQLKVVAADGKAFQYSDSLRRTVTLTPGVSLCNPTLEDNAMAQYQDRQVMVTIKGVGDDFEQLTTFDEILLGNGRFVLSDEVAEYGILGIGIPYQLNSGYAFVDPLSIYAPRRGKRINMSNPLSNVTVRQLYNPGLVFRVNQERYDTSYIITSLAFAEDLFDRAGEVTALELRVADGYSVAKVKKALARRLGERFCVQDRYEQQDEVFHIVKIEKFISYLFLCFILAIACFNIISSVSMLILDKQPNIATLRSMGADERFIGHIFITEGNLISLCGAAIGLVLGVLLCLLQQWLGFIPLGEAGAFVVDAYPVSVHLKDVILVFFTVLTVSALSVWLPIRLLSRRLLEK